MRIRAIKPEFFKHDRLAELSAHHRLLFIGLWMLADREGRLEDRPARIKAEVFPYERMDVNRLLDELHDAPDHFICRYEVEGRRLIEVTAFSRHQHVNVREADTLLPARADTCTHVQARVEQEGKGTGREQEQERERKGTGKEQEAAVTTAVRVVLDHYRTHHPKSKFGPESKEGKLIRSRLSEGYSTEDLCAAIEGCHKSAFHLGENDTGQPYLGLDLILRDGSHVDKFMAFAVNGAPAKPVKGSVQKIGPVLRDFVDRKERES